MCVFILFSPSSLIFHINVSLYDTIYCTTSFDSVQLTMDDGSSETCLDWLNNMHFKNIVWFIKAISYFVLLRSLGYNWILLITHLVDMTYKQITTWERETRNKLFFHLEIWEFVGFIGLLRWRFLVFLSSSIKLQLTEIIWNSPDM